MSFFIIFSGRPPILLLPALKRCLILPAVMLSTLGYTGPGIVIPIFMAARIWASAFASNSSGCKLSTLGSSLRTHCGI